MDERGIESANNHEAKVAEFYHAIDLGDYQKLFNECDSKIIYEREGLENKGKMRIEGIDTFKNFYINERKLVGTHNTESVQTEGNRIVVLGNFAGTNDGVSIKLRYKDIWVFNMDGKVTYRLSQIVLTQ
jgi:ketosteroid isomerase-like protein